MLNRIVILAVCSAALFGCGQVDPDDYAPVGSQYGRSDGWFADSSGNWQQIVNGSETGTYFSSGGNLVVAGTQTFTGDLTLSGGAGCLTVSGSGDSTLVAADADATAFCMGAAGALDLVCLDTTDASPAWDIKGVAGQVSLHVDAGTAQFDESPTIGAGVAATDYTLTFNGETNDCVMTCMEDETRLDVEGNLQFGTGGAGVDYTLTADGETNDGTLTWKEDESLWDFTDAIKTPTPLLGLKTAYFCGNGANATTAVYMPPVIPGTEAADGSTYEYGEAGCDGLDNTTETSGDDYIQGNGALAISVVGMACGISAAGTDDTYTFQLRDDAADVTGVTCNVTLDGSIQECTVLLDAPVVMAAGSLAAVKNVASTDDNVSAADVECVVFYTYAF
jgi:hypothetical protein